MLFISFASWFSWIPFVPSIIGCTLSKDYWKVFRFALSFCFGQLSHCCYGFVFLSSLKQYLHPNSLLGSVHHQHSSSQHHHPNHHQGFSEKRCIGWFHEYTTQGESQIGPEGMEKFCKDIGVAPENVIMLGLAWNLGAKNMGFFSSQEWIRGMSHLQWVHH